jgi:hypothetical protein
LEREHVFKSTEDVVKAIAHANIQLKTF